MKNRVSPEKSNASSMSSVLQDYLGKPVAVLCARFNYRGILSKVTDDCLILAQARAVESSGASSSNRPNSEDPIGSSVIISLNAVELVYQPNWVFAPLED
jgi:predicted transcriptional regulator YheO